MKHENRPILALLLRLLSGLAFSVMFVFVKLSGQNGVSLPEVMFWRQAGCLPWVALWLAATGQLGSLRTKRAKSHAARGLVGMSNMAMNFGAAMMLPLAEFTTLSFTAPIFAVLIAASVFKDHVGKFRWTAVALGFAGVLIVARPGGAPIPPLGLALALASTLFVAIINFQIRDLAKTEASGAIVFWFSVFGALIALPAYLLMRTPHSGEQWLMLLGMGFLGALGQVFMTASLRFGAVTSVIIMDYASLLWASGLGWLIWDRLPAHSTVLGAPLIIAAGIIIAVREHRLARRPVPDPAEPVGAG